MKFKDFLNLKDYYIYIDLDGVLCDFKKQFEDIANKPINEVEKNKIKFWKIINDAGLDFWSKMKWIKNSQKMWDYIKNNFKNIKILSVCSRKKESKIGKKIWVKKELGNIKGIYVNNPDIKKKYANKKSILIDDRKDNIRQWKESGGIGILFQTPEQVISELKKLK